MIEERTTEPAPQEAFQLHLDGTHCQIQQLELAADTFQLGDESEDDDEDDEDDEDEDDEEEESDDDDEKAGN